MNPKVSIVLPVYNGADRIRKSIDSILAQTFKDFELIVVNDCSTDNTKVIVEEYVNKDNRVKLYNNPQNMKLPRSLNNGFRQASGEYWSWTSDDNMYRENAIETLVSELERDKSVSMVYSDYTCIDENDEVLYVAKKEKGENIRYNNVCGASFLYRADAAKKAGEYDPDLFLAEDYEYWIRLSKYGKLRHIEDDLYMYRLHSKSLTATRQEAIKLQTYKAMEKHFLYLYSSLNTRKERIHLLDHMYKWVEDTNDSEARSNAMKQICSIMPSYDRNRKIRKIVDKYKFW